MGLKFQDGPVYTVGNPDTQNQSEFDKHLKVKNADAYSHAEQGSNKNGFKTMVNQAETVAKAVSGTMEVSFDAGQTINLGDFNSLRVQVGIRVPCDKATLEETYEWATDWVSEKIKKIVTEAKS